MAPRKTAVKANKKGVMTDAHKAALQKGRDEGRAIGAYLEALKASKPRRGRKRTLANVKKQLETIEMRIAAGKESPAKLLALYQQRIDLKAELSAKQEVSAMDELEMAFVAIAKNYADRRGISKEAWLEAGVPARVIRAAGIK